MAIRLSIDESDAYNEVEIIIKCPHIDKQLSSIIEQIKHHSLTLSGSKNGRMYALSIESLYYMESVDSKTFIYDKRDVYESDLKLYELEDFLKETPFIRVSKSLIVNTTHVKHVKALFNGKFEVSLSNGEKVIVSRHYGKVFKAKFLR